MGVTGSVLRVNGPVVEAAGMDGAAMLEIVAVGERGCLARSSRWMATARPSRSTSTRAG